MKFNFKKLKLMAASARPSTRKLFKQIEKRRPKDLDEVAMKIDKQVFKEIDCKDCANCCKTSTPTFTRTDLARISKHFKMTQAEFSDKYLYRDKEGDLILKTVPCPFLGKDNLCTVYEVRPQACAEYPHSGRKYFHQRLDWTMGTVENCPALYEIVERLKTHYNDK